MFNPHKLIMALAMFINAYALLSQTTRQVIVEHFTNTRCSICASKNPAFYSLLHGSYPQVLHLAYHPSAPYSNCYFSLQNPTENNSRTNFYGVYGSTPRAVIQGKVIPIKTPLVNAADFDTELNQTSPFTISVTLTESTFDSVEVRIVTKAVATHPYIMIDLYAAITEDSIFYNAANGEALHFDVFREQLFTSGTYPIVAPANVGDSVVVNEVFKINSNWQKQQTSVIAIIQEQPTKFILQATKQQEIENLQVTNDMEEIALQTTINVYPNPAVNEIYWKGKDIDTVTIYNTVGEVLKEVKGSNRMLSLVEFSNGIYFLNFKTVEEGVFIKRIIICK